MSEDTNSIIREFLINQATLTAVVGTKIYCPRLPENTVLPAISFFTRGGLATPYIPDLPEPSVQFDCWDTDPRLARLAYNALYDVLQGVQNQAVTVGGVPYTIWSAIQEAQGQDLVDVDIQGYFKTMTFFKFIIRVA